MSNRYFGLGQGAVSDDFLVRYLGACKGDRDKSKGSSFNNSDANMVQNFA